MKHEGDEQLLELAIAAQQHPPHSLGRQRALRQLVNSILRSGRLCHPQRGKFAGVYEEIYDEALQELLLYVCENIERFDSNRASVMTWVNMLLERRFFREAIPKILDRPGFQRMNLSDLDNLASPQESECLTETLTKCIETDPDNILKKEHIANHPEANFQILAQRRIAGKSWKDIAAELDLKVATVSSFYSRCLTKLSPKLKAYCIDQD